MGRPYGKFVQNVQSVWSVQPLTAAMLNGQSEDPAPVMQSINVDLDVSKAIAAHQRDTDETPNTVLRRLLRLEPADALGDSLVDKSRGLMVGVAVGNLLPDAPLASSAIALLSSKSLPSRAPLPSTK